MALSHGMNVEAVRGIADRLRRASDQLDHIRVSTDRLTHDALHVWAGADAHAFAADWTNQFRPGVVSVAQAIDGLAKSAGINADQQVEASGGGGGSASTLEPFRKVLDAEGKFVSFGGDVFKNLDHATKLDKSIGSILGRTGGIFSTAGSLTEVIQDPNKASSWLGLLSSGPGVAESFAPKAAQDVLGRAAGSLAVGADVAKMFNAFDRGDTAAGVYWSLHAGVGSVGVFVKPVALGLAAWDLGTTIGTIGGEAYLQTSLGQADQQSTLDWGARMVGGDPTTDPAAASRLSQRYDGIGGFGNFVGDSVLSKAYALNTWMTGAQ